MRVLIILLSIRYNVCVCHSPLYHYITATAVCVVTTGATELSRIINWDRVDLSASYK